MVYDDDDHYRINNKNAEEAEMAYARKSMQYMIVSHKWTLPYYVE